MGGKVDPFSVNLGFGYFDLVVKCYNIYTNKQST
jgi:hypothetical protein